MLMSWLKSSLSPVILLRVLGSIQSYQVWDKIHQIGPFEGPDHIFISNGQGLPIRSSGSSFFLSQYNPKLNKNDQFFCVACYIGKAHRYPSPHTHHQNRVIERKHRHIIELSLTLLSHASLPLKFCDSAFTSVVYLINKLPTTSLKLDVPYNVLFKQIPDYKFLKTFGCACFPLLRPYNNHKLNFSSHECVFLGYSSSHKGYKCLSPTGRIFISKDVVFNEYRFPYYDLFPNNINPLLHSIDTSQHVTSASIPILKTLSPQIIVHNSNVPVVTTNPSHDSSTDSSLNSSCITNLSNNTNFFVPPLNTESSLPITSQNVHPMKTGSKSGISKPKLHYSIFLIEYEPKSVRQALKDPKWLATMQHEYNLVNLPQNKKVIGCKWVFKIKENLDGTVNRYKARLVAKGFHQQHGFNFNKTFSPDIKLVTIRLILTLVIINNWEIHQLDVNNSFLNGLLNETFYMHQSPSFETDSTMVCKLNKALYGLKQAPRQWFDRLQTTLL
uniref:Retrovirus-related Pol polyprotein from transposon TNT 1-94 n=1 Tax=Cajanus cajan TaxID=3821 RepID=A0A151RHI2_CAJCA|nr:Retrovirus-related Pol polyprotein from transposon TNT 1-94 [Cajanus cajan]